MTRLGKPEFTVEGKKFDLMSVDDDRFGFYDQHDDDDMTGGAAVQDGVGRFNCLYPFKALTQITINTPSKTIPATRKVQCN